MNEKLIKEVRFLKLYAIVTTVIFAGLFTFGFTKQGEKYIFEEIDVERINIVEKTGELRMVISNQARQHPGIVNGKIIERSSPRPPGMIFFNHLGDEMGGFVFGENGGNGHFAQFSLDKVHGDQTIAFRHLEGDNGAYTSGLFIWQQPNIPSDIVQANYKKARSIEDEDDRKAAIQKLRDNDELTTERLFLGKNRENTTYLIMSDIKGKARIIMAVTAEGNARLDFLDANGEVTYSLPK